MLVANDVSAVQRSSIVVALRMAMLVTDAEKLGKLRRRLVRPILIEGIAPRFQSSANGKIPAMLEIMAARVSSATSTSLPETAINHAKRLRALIDSKDEPRPSIDEIISHVRLLGTTLLTLAEDQDPSDPIRKGGLQLGHPSGHDYIKLLKLADTPQRKMELFGALGMVMESQSRYGEARTFYVQSRILNT